MRISDWSSDVCSSDLLLLVIRTDYAAQVVTIQKYVTLLRQWRVRSRLWFGLAQWLLWVPVMLVLLAWLAGFDLWAHSPATVLGCLAVGVAGLLATPWLIHWSPASVRRRSEEHTSELQSLMRISYAVFCLKKKKNPANTTRHKSYIEGSNTQT